MAKKKMSREGCEKLLIDAGYPMTGKDRILYVQQEKGFLRVSILWPHRRHFEDDLRKELRQLFNDIRYGTHRETYDDEGEMIRDEDGNQVMEVVTEPRYIGQPVQVDYKVGINKFRSTVPHNMAGHDCAEMDLGEWGKGDAAQRQRWLVK